MSEEKVTIAILQWLERNGWTIIAYDFPQSGTGTALHPTSKTRDGSKNRGAIIPDIVAHRNGTTLFFEDKDRFVVADFEKIHQLKTGGEYNGSIAALLKNWPTSKTFFGIGLPASKTDPKKLEQHGHLVDFVVTVSPDGGVRVLKDPPIFEPKKD